MMARHQMMAEALRRVRAGELMQATSLIQAMIAGSAGVPPTPSPPTPSKADPVTIDLVAERVTLAPDPVSVGAASVASFSECRHLGSAGALDYRLYVPAGAAPGMPIVVMLHGCTQSPEDFARGTGMNRLADGLGFLVAYPRQSRAANAQMCWNWFRPGDQQRDHGEPALIAGIARDVLRDHAADPSRVYVAGLSAGGAAAATVAARYPDVFAAVGIHSGLACGAARDLSSALGAMRSGGGAAVARAGAGFVPTIAFHGDRDATVDARNGREIVAAAAAAFGTPLATETHTGQSDGGRRYTRESNKDASGRELVELWTIHGAGHAWAGGDASGSYTDPRGPDASREMLRFFLGHALEGAPIPA